MENQNYLMIQNGVVINVCVWNGDTQQWNPPSDATMLVQATTPSFDWVWNPDLKDYELTESIGTGSVGYTWNGTACITNQEKPVVIIAKEQPTTSGTQEL